MSGQADVMDSGELAGSARALNSWRASPDRSSGLALMPGAGHGATLDPCSHLRRPAAGFLPEDQLSGAALRRSLAQDPA
jgi:hypothetical protein